VSNSKAGKSKRRWRDRLPFADLRARATEAKFNWNSTPEERQRSYACDTFVRSPQSHYYRALDSEIQAPPEMVYRWMCQLRVAPYSYDYIDNYCRRSPRRLIPGLDDLEPGQHFIRIFDLVSFKPGREITMRIGRQRWFWGPDIGCTYVLTPTGPDSCRAFVKVVTHRASGPRAALRRKFFPWGEIFMLNKQLKTFKKLAEKQYREMGATQAVSSGRKVPATP